jgi:DNA-binding response OmpR family regulator
MKKSAKILIIDDEWQDRKAMTLALKKEGYKHVETADTAERGIAMAKSFNPDIVVIDVVLSNADGFDVCKKFNRMKGLGAKIVMITGHLDAVNAEKARHSGADELLVKAPSFENIGKTIKAMS